jgi:hypothetical protein
VIRRHDQKEPSMIHPTKTKLAVALAIAAAAVPSAASAKFDLNPEPAANAAPAHVHDSQGRSAGPSDEGFQWGDAGLGAVAAITLLGVGTAVATAGRRRGRGVSRPSQVDPARR